MTLVTLSPKQILEDQLKMVHKRVVRERKLRVRLRVQKKECCECAREK